jgi:class 3 adenylate cyclase
MQQIADWLKKLGMSEYAERFIENRIDLSVLQELTDQDLKDLGVVLGDRRKMQRAIRDLRDVSGAVTAPSTPVEADPTRRDDAERRQLTVMFTDLVGSTALSTKLDPEDMRSVIGVYHKCVAETVTRFDGFVAKYMGDGVLAYFGYPQAHEDDAERAVQAGLALIEAVGKLGVQEPLRVRIGVATGLVVVDDIVGSGEAQERGVVGETPNLAARLQALAGPGALLIADRTRQLIGELFDLVDLGPQALAGFVGSQRVWRVVGESAVLSRSEALRSGAAPLGGRGEEIDLLKRRWEQAKAGEGRVVLISGEPGIGKSRLTAALRVGGRFAEAKAALDRSLDMIEQREERLWEAENYRVRGEVAREEGDSSAAFSAFETAIIVAKRQFARSLELRASLAWARLAANQGRREEARDRLALICSSFVDGFDTPELRAANKLLIELT